MQTRSSTLAARVQLMSLPDELLHIICGFLSCDDIVRRVIRLSSRWLKLIQTEMHLLARVHHKATCDSEAFGTRAAPWLLRAMWTQELLCRYVGLPPPHRTWRDEWRRLDTEQDLDQGNPPMPAWAYEDGNDASIEARLQNEHFAKAVAWQVKMGWRLDNAQAYTLLFNHCRGTLGKHIARRTPRYGASTHTFYDALGAAALAQAAGPLAPDVFTNLCGDWGLQTVDPAWVALTAPGAKPGLRFRTSAPAGAEVADANAFPNTKGCHVPLTFDDGVTVWKCQRGPVVKFVAREPCAHGLRSLVQTSPTAYDLPPLATVQLEEILPSGSWLANGKRVRQKCFVVSVEYAAP